MRDAAAWLELPMNPHPTRLRRATLSHKRERGGTPNDLDSVIKKARTRRRGASTLDLRGEAWLSLVHVASIVPLAHFARRAGVFRRARSGEGRDSRRSRPAAHHRRQEQRAADRLENLQRAPRLRDADRALHHAAHGRRSFFRRIRPGAHALRDLLLARARDPRRHAARAGPAGLAWLRAAVGGPRPRALRMGRAIWRRPHRNHRRRDQPRAIAG